MNAKKTIVGTVTIIFVVICLSTLSAGAASEWITCSVNMAGPSGTNTLICLSDTAPTPAFTKKWFIAPAGREKEITAIALGAIINNMKVIIKAVEGPYLEAIYLLNDRDEE